MDPTLEEKQKDQSQQEQSKKGGISQGINAINSLARSRGGLKNPLGKVGQRVTAQTALRGFSALLASQVGLPIVIALGAILFFTIFIIMGFGGGAPPSETGVQAPIVEPTETPTPTPAP